MFREVDTKIDLPKLEEGILNFWDENKTFTKSIKNRQDAPLYSFYDGPPFATGTPHYGHIVASTMKDVVPRYWTMKGYQVPRVWGWDCHGLPIENIAEKELGITQKKQIIEMGVDKFNAACRSRVLDYVKEWETVIRRLGRWVDMKNAYRTMDLSYMESVWWVFKALWDKGLIYEGYRSMHICPRCETTLSQSEVAEGYKMVRDISIIAKFHLLPNQEYGKDKKTKDTAYILAWTTTPWTLIGNVALAVGRDINYTAFRLDGIKKLLIAASDLVEKISEGHQIEIVHDDIKGSELVGLRYEPLFDYYAKQSDLKNRDNGWQIVDASFVTTEEGTGVVHIAPAFGEDDMKLGQEKCLPFVQHVGMDGVIRPEVGEFAGMYVKAIDDYQKTDVEIIKYLDRNNLLFSKAKYEHSYPYCWRCDSPLLNYATTSWFVDILTLKDEAIKLSKDINWSPKHIKEGRFGKWLEGARDWSISRQRFWASVIPIWRCEDCGELTVLGSVAELEKLSGQKVTDLHKDFVDKINFPCPKCTGKSSRIPDVLDTWFDSGSMPYAQLHYPFENQDMFEKSFPAEFIAEGVDQTRAWFYYLHIIATAIFNSPAYKNVIVNGIVLAEDGKKMSKKLKNYPDPALMFDQYGADVMRFYLMSSPVVAVENLNFKESEMVELYRGMFRMLWNSYSFFVLYANIDNFQVESEKLKVKSDNILDRWIISELNKLIMDVDESMKKYDLMKTARSFPLFIDNLSNWYIRRSRKRFGQSADGDDKNQAFHTLYEVLVTLSKLMAPFTPFITEDIYKNLTGDESVHLTDFPEANKALIDEDLGRDMQQVRSSVETALSLRAAAGIKIRQPLNSFTYTGKQLNSELEEVVTDEINVENVHHGKEEILDTEITEELKAKGFAREIIRNIQSLRKESGFKITDHIEVYYQTDSDELNRVMEEMQQIISKDVLANKIVNAKCQAGAAKEYQINGSQIWIGINKQHHSRSA